MRLECSHFLECIRTGAQPQTDGHNGLRVVQIIEAAQQSLQENGALISPIPSPLNGHNKSYSNGYSNGHTVESHTVLQA